MQYRKFGKLDWQASVLGFGAMRFPVVGNDQGHIDVPEAIRMIRYGIDHGVNYLDTAYPYHSGQSERLVGLALKDGYRDRVKLATKMPCRHIKSPNDFDRIFNEQLDKLQTDKLDFYLLHGLNSSSWPKVRGFGILPWAERQMAQGRIGHLGFSFHDEYDVFKQIVDDYDNWMLCQVLFNYMDVDYQAGRKGIEYAAGKGLAVAVMEPLRGGQLTRQPPAPVAGIWESAPASRSLAEWGLLWVWNHPEVTVALSGMSSMAQVVENIAIAAKSGVGNLSAEEMQLIDRVREAYQGLSPIPCTECRYCMPCTGGVEIPAVLRIYNEVMMYNDMQRGHFRYLSPAGLTEDQRGDRCTECGECLEACPQKINIPEWLKKTHAMLAP